MKLSCCAYSFRQELTSGRMRLDQFLDRAAEMGFDGVELTAYYFPDTQRDTLLQVKDRAHKCGLTVSGAAIGTDFANPDPDVRSKSVQMTHDWVVHSAELGAPTLRVFAGSLRDGIREEDAVGWTVDALRECAEFAGQHGVTLALENHGGITATAEQTLRLVDRVDSAWLRINLDFGNFTDDIYSQFEECAPLAIATHAKRHYRGPEGPARVDYGKVRNVLETARYRGWIAIEYEDPEDPAVAVPVFAQELRKVFEG